MFVVHISQPEAEARPVRGVFLVPLDLAHAAVSDRHPVLYVLLNLLHAVVITSDP